MASKQMIFNLIYRNCFEIYELLIKKTTFQRDFESFLVNGKFSFLKDEIKTLEKISLDKYACCYTRLDIIDEILEYTKDKYYHLKEIRDVVVLDSILNEVLDEKLYRQLLHLHYVKQILLLIDSNISNIYLSVYYHQSREKLFKKVTKNIDDYYIAMITS